MLQLPVLHVQLLEFAGWASFLFLEVYPKVYAGPGSMYDAPWWRGTARVWEVVVFVLFGYEYAAPLWAAGVVAGWALWRWRASTQHTRSSHHGSTGAPCPAHHSSAP